MKKSESIKNIAKALQCFHVKVDTIKKDAKNPFFKSSYASLPNILDAINEPLIESDLTLTMFPTDEHGLYCLLMHTESGEWIESVYTMSPVKNTPQEKGSCLSYQRRYCISSILNLTIDDILKDDDGNSASGTGHNYVNNSDKPELQWLNKNTEAFDKVKQFILTGGDITKVREKYKISKEIEKLLTTK